MTVNKINRVKSGPINVLGLMSGTSLDGIDLALCTFNDRYKMQIRACKTFAYPAAIAKKLRTAMQMTSDQLAALDMELGIFYGRLCRGFLLENRLKADLISSHGHTIFHEPQRGYTVQIGHGGAIAATAGITVASDFRSSDVALGGQGAPLVPIGDELLFGHYKACLNLGGIANISFRKKNQRIAFDITVCNMAMNEIALRVGKKYDKGGALACAGTVQHALLKKMNALSYFRKSHPKSLGREWYEQQFQPLLKTVNPEDLLATLTEHVAIQVAKCVAGMKGQMLVTGGGAHNDFLLAKLGEKSDLKIIVPETKIIDFKEAVIFALLGYLRLQNQVNTLASVTGAQRNHCAGALYTP